MPDPHLRHAADGHLMFGATGHLTNACNTGGGTFQDCRGLGIQCAKITAAGIVLCPDAVNSDGGLFRRSTGNPNGTYFVPVCQTVASTGTCWFFRSFCDVTSYATATGYCGLTAWGLASSLDFSIALSLQSPGRYQIETRAVLRHWRLGCCNALATGADAPVFCWKPVFNSTTNTTCGPTAPTGTHRKFCPCASNATTINLGGSLGVANITPPINFGSFVDGPIVIGDSRVVTGTPTTFSFTQGTGPCDSATPAGSYMSNGGTITVEFKYPGDPENCPLSDVDNDDDCICDCGEEDI